MFKKLALVLLLGLFSVTAFGAEHRYVACTADKSTVAFTVDLKDSVVAKHPEVVKHIGAAFKNAANKLTLEELFSDVGFQLFGSQLTDEDWAAMPRDIGYPTLISNTCK